MIYLLNLQLQVLVALLRHRFDAEVADQLGAVLAACAVLLPRLRVLLLFAFSAYFEVELLFPCLFLLLSLVNRHQNTVLHQCCKRVQTSDYPLLKAKQVAVPAFLLSLLPFALEGLVEGQIICLFQQHLVANAKLRIAVAQPLEERYKFMV